MLVDPEGHGGDTENLQSTTWKTMSGTIKAKPFHDVFHAAAKKLTFARQCHRYLGINCSLEAIFCSHFFKTWWDTRQQYLQPPLPRRQLQESTLSNPLRGLPRNRPFRLARGPKSRTSRDGQTWPRHLRRHVKA